MSNPDVILSIERIRTKYLEELHAFHVSQTTEFIWPRTINELNNLAENESLYVVFANNVRAQTKYIIAMCYVIETKDEGTNYSWEFGGLCVSDDFRGYGIGTALGIVAISSHYLYDLSRINNNLVSHVHEDNTSSQPSEKRQPSQIEKLGFTYVGQQKIPDNLAPLNMRRNTDGLLVGNFYEFQHSSLNHFADWLESFGGTISGKIGAYPLKLKLLAFSKRYRKGAINELRKLAINLPK